MYRQCRWYMKEIVPMTSNSPHHQHETARRAALIALARYGYLRASDLALLVYFDKLSGVRLAQRLLAKLYAVSVRV
jgi:hypothetical protein